MILGVGVDIVDIERFERSLERTAGLAERLFVDAERSLPIASLAARFAAKEALIKAFGGSAKMSWHEMVVVKNAEGAPRFELSGNAAALASERGVSSIQLSLSHDAGSAIAFVVASTNEAGTA